MAMLPAFNRLSARTLLVFSIAGAAFFSSFASASPLSAADFSPKVDSAAKRALAEPNAAGFSIAVARNGEILFAKAYGPADAELGVPLSPDSIMRIGSVTKQFSAAAIMRLVEQGKVSLDAEIQTYLPDFPKKEWPVTVRHILNHTSGIWSYTDDEKWMDRDASLELAPKELVALFADKPLEFEPGTKWKYSNSAYYLLGPIIEQASGKSYAAFVQEEFFTPLKLTNTRHESNTDIILNRAQGYNVRRNKLSNDKPIGADVPGAAGSLLSTASDLCKWEDLLSSGRVVSADSYKQMTTPATLSDGKPTNYGFGLKIDEWEGRRRISHGGGIFGFTSMLLTLPKDDNNPDTLTVAVLSNSESYNSGKLADIIARYALGIPVFEPKDFQLTTEDFARFTGDFAFEGIPLEIKFFEKDNQLWSRATGQGEIRLLYQGNDEFRAAFDSTVKIIFDGPDAFTLHQGRAIPAKRKK